jgi:protein gp37
MADHSAIEWTEATWNPVAGCLMVSPGCTNCYAMRMAGRLEAMGLPKYRGTTRRSGRRFVWTGRVVVDDEALSVPAQWRKPRRIFVNSMSDLFQDAVPHEFIGKVWRAMEKANWHTYQILTKRPERMRAILSGGEFKVLPNIWLGTSVESGDYVGRIDLLRATRAAVRFISFEPLVGRIGEVDLRGIDWAIVGGESGPRCRPIEPAWVREIRASCEEQGVAFFFKQWGGRNKKAAGRRLDGRTWDGYPESSATAVA